MTSNNHFTTRPRLLALALPFTAVMLTGCVVHPTPLSMAERRNMLATDHNAMFDNQQPVKAPITMDEAMARALKYNLESRVKLMEEALAQRQLDLSSIDLLPKLAASAGYSNRNNVLGSSSRSVLTGQQSLEPSTSSDKTSHNADLNLSWNILDFGVSYFGAKQQADKLLGLQERRRKVVQLLMQQIREAFWQAAGAQQLQARIEPLLTQAQQALEDSRNIEKSNLTAPLQALSYQRELLELILQLEGIRDELSQAKPKLAALMDLPPGQSYELAVPAMADNLAVNVAPDKMEETALLNRPELIEASYNERIGLNETHRAMASLFPGVELSIGDHYDSNSFLVNKNWNDVGVRVSWNLLNLVSAHTIRAAAKAQYQLAHEQRLAANMAVLSQVHVAWIDFNSRKQQFELVHQLSDVEQRMLEHTQNATAADAEGKLAEIRAATSALMSELRLYQSYSAYQESYGQILTTLGVDPVPATMANADINTLTTAIHNQSSHP